MGSIIWDLPFSLMLGLKFVSNVIHPRRAIFAKGFGRITDLEIGPDGYMYVLSSEDDGAILYKISKAS